MEIRILTKKQKFMKIFTYTEICGLQYRTKATSGWKFYDPSKIEVIDNVEAFQTDHKLPM